jgi:Tfp pilus assembly pilus retraction ATPase PilT
MATQIVNVPLPETAPTPGSPSFERPLAPATQHLFEAPAPAAHVEQPPVDEDAGLFALPPFIVDRFEAVAPEAPVGVVAPAPAGAAPHVRRAPAPAASADVLDVTDDLDELMADAAERGATALYLRAGQVPSARVDERLQRLDEAVVSASMLTAILASCTAGRDGWTAGEHGEWIREFDLAGLVKCYPFEDQAGDGAVIRLTPRSAVHGLQRHIPRQVRRACESEDGLVLVAGATHPEVLAMTAAVGDVAARKRAGYVICLQPNGLPHPISGAFVSERRLEGSADEVSARIRRAVQEAPDILVVGAVDSPVALEEVILSSATPGRLVILGVVAPTALRGVESVLATVGREREPQIRRTLAAALRAAFGHRGLRRLGGGRTSVQDVVVGTSDVLTRLERADFGGIEQAQRQGWDGMRTLDAALARAVARRHVSLRQAAALATSKSELVALTRRSARERRALARDHRSEWRQGALRAI